MSAVRGSLSLLILVALVACAAPPRGALPVPEPAEIAPGRSFTLWLPCTREEGARWAEKGRHDPEAAIMGASCYAVLAQGEEDRGRRLADTRRGRGLAQKAAEAWPRSGAAHYLVAYLTGMEAEQTPLRGLDLVPVIEESARLASTLDPALDAGGPFRMLGELYLRAPGFPVSVGDPKEAVAAFRKATEIAPTAENRRGLGEALLAAGDTREGCAVLDAVSEDPQAGREVERARELLKKGCQKGHGD